MRCCGCTAGSRKKRSNIPVESAFNPRSSIVMREEVVGNARLILGDARDIIRGLEFGAIVTDPPYGINHKSSYGASWQNTKIAGDNDPALRDEVLRGWPTVASFGTWKTPPIENAIGCLVFDKGPAFGMGDLSFPWKPSFELIYIRGKAWRGRRDEGVLRGHVQVSWETQFKGLGDREARSHPHQKPFSICEALLLKLPSDLVILDPFMGSGTTGVACMRMGRPFIGIEIDPHHFETSCRRIDKSWRQRDLFVDAPVPIDPADHRAVDLFAEPDA